MNSPLDSHALDQLFRSARSLHTFRDAAVPDEVLRELFELMQLGPTAFNSLPARVVFLRTPEAKARLAPTLSRGNLDKTLAAPVTAILAIDSRFFETMSHEGGRSFYAANPAIAAEHAFRNASLQAGYFILTARALGLTAGPMSGFDAAKLDAEFFPDGRWRANILVNLGWGADAPPPTQRASRLSAEQGAIFL